MKRTKVRELLREELLSMLANSKRNDKLREPPIKISEGRLLRIVQEEIAREVGRISDSRDLLYEAAYEEFTHEMWKKKMPMKRGHSGGLVKAIQVLLNIKADGKFGPNTEKALKEKAAGATALKWGDYGRLAKALEKSGDATKEQVASAKKEVVTWRAGDAAYAAAAEKKAKAAAEKATGEKAVAAHEKAKVDAATKKAEEEKVAAAKKTGGSYNWHPSRPPYNLSAKDVERIWDEHVTSKDMKAAKNGAWKAFRDGVKSKSWDGTNQGRIFAALYFGGGWKKSGIDEKSKYTFNKSAKKAIQGEWSGSNDPEERFALWLGAGDRRKVMTADGVLKEKDK